MVNISYSSKIEENEQKYPSQLPEDKQDVEGRNEINVGVSKQKS